MLVENEKMELFLEAGMVTDYLEQRGKIRVNEKEWRNDFIFGAMLPMIMKDEFQNLFVNQFYSISERKKYALIREYLVQKYGCTVERPIALGCLAYFFFVRASKGWGDKCIKIMKRIPLVRRKVRVDRISVLNVSKIQWKEKYGEFLKKKDEIHEEVVEMNDKDEETATEMRIEIGQDKMLKMKWLARCFSRKFVLRPYWMMLTKKNIQEQGFFFLICTRARQYFKIIMRNVVMHCRANDIDAKTWIFEEWKKKWTSDYENEEYQHFIKLFEYDYDETCRKVRSNRRKNFMLKGISFFPIMLFAWIFVQSFVLSKAISSNMDFVYAGVAVLSGILLQWIEVKKYQETWIRHARHKFVLDNEMFKFISEIDEYESLDRKKIFRDKIRCTWEENNSLFLKNMKNETKIKGVSESVKEAKEVFKNSF